MTPKELRETLIRAATAPKCDALVKAVEGAVTANTTFMEADKQPSNHRRLGMDDYFALVFPIIEAMRPILAAHRKQEGK